MGAPTILIAIGVAPLAIDSCEIVARVLSQIAGHDDHQTRRRVLGSSSESG